MYEYIVLFKQERMNTWMAFFMYAVVEKIWGFWIPKNIKKEKVSLAFV